MDLDSFPILTILILLPLLGVAALTPIPSTDARVLRVVAFGAALVTFAVSLLLLAAFVAGEAGFQLTEQVAWIPEYGITYALGVDGVSLFLVLLTTLIVPLAILAAWEQSDRSKGFLVSLLALQSALIGIFVSLDLILFYFFFEVSLVPMYALIGIWGGRNRRYAAVKFFLYTLVGGLTMLVGILYLYFAGGAESFAYEALLDVPLTPGAELLCFLAFAIAFAIKVPLFPLHTWLPDAHTEAPTAGSVVLAAIMLKIGGYGFLRFCLPYFPEATRTVAPVVLGLAIVGILYGALVAAMQRDIKKLVAYSSVAHLGFVVLGTFSLDTTAAAASKSCRWSTTG